MPSWLNKPLFSALFSTICTGVIFLCRGIAIIVALNRLGPDTPERIKCKKEDTDSSPQDSRSLVTLNR